MRIIEIALENIQGYFFDMNPVLNKKNYTFTWLFKEISG